MVTNLNIQPRTSYTNKRGKKYTRETLVSDAKIQVCIELGIKERPYKDANGEADCTVTLTYKNMTRLAKLMEEFKGQYFPEFERTLTAFMRRFKHHFGNGQEYASFWDRIFGRPLVCDWRSSGGGVELNPGYQ